MALKYDIEVEVSGKEHHGKTTLVAYLVKLLKDAGAEVIVQRADPQIDQKLALTEDELRARVAGKTIFIREFETLFETSKPA
jgi:CO dehydrogenase nickel-insertion accessory protein CooC1